MILTLRRWLIAWLVTDALDTQWEAYSTDRNALLTTIRNRTEQVDAALLSRARDAVLLEIRMKALTDRVAPLGSMQRAKWLRGLQARIDKLIAEHNAQVAPAEEPT